MADHRGLVEAIRLENLIKRKRRRVMRLAEEFQGAELERQVLERELTRLRSAAQAPTDAEFSAAVDVARRAVEALDHEDSQAAPSVASEQKASAPAPPVQPAAGIATGAAGDARGSQQGGNATGALPEPAPAAPTSAGSGAVPVSASAGVAAPEPRRGLRTPCGQHAKDETGNTKARWRCGCDCGREFFAEGNDLRTGVVSSCPDCNPKARRCTRCGQKGHSSRACAAEVSATEKVCTRCVTSKPRDNFYGRNAVCKACFAAAYKPRAPAPADAAPTEKRCVQCGQTKPISEYYAHPSGKGQARCKLCDNSTRVKRSRIPPTPADSVPRQRRFVCFKCGSMPHRVEGVRCSGCGLERAEEKFSAVDFSGGDSALARAIG